MRIVRQTAFLQCKIRCGRFSAFFTRFVCIAPRAFYQMLLQRGIEPTFEVEICLAPAYRCRRVLGAFDKLNQNAPPPPPPPPPPELPPLKPPPPPEEDDMVELATDIAWLIALSTEETVLSKASVNIAKLDNW